MDKRWFLIWVLIYGTFLLGDFVAPGFVGITVLKMMGLFLCFVYACQKFPRDHLLKIAIGLTILSDVILALDNVNVWGVFVFCFAHFFHLARLAGTSPKFLAVFAAFVLLTGVFGVMVRIPPMLVIGFIYAVTLMSNVWLALRWRKAEPANPRSTMAALGFLFFLACDINVALDYCSTMGWLPLALYPVVNYFVWAFYYPSQVFIANSSKCDIIEV